ncbi:TonB-dependent siderophore receptor [Pseudomonas matsuisoli]|uniref:Fe(3+)-pyochelin receptor n=1 Tax=Pseudomonas matsuisoli TaxID=1515666 RepID=A0A917PVB8_9PSED|nr:TonB-dependent siderophore receptor [Pseudomonas matsuisoli]GGJ93548.1 Fe(3+)-pyochelin receptor [Pseudomonas matsuisoli]
MSKTLYCRYFAFSALTSLSMDAWSEAPPTTLPDIQVEGRHLSGDGGSYKAEAITVGTKAALAPIDVPQSVSVITQTRMNDQNLLTIGDVLNEVTGVSIAPWDSITQQYYSRGYSLDMAYDGVPVYGGTSGIQEYDMSIYERVEVLRGPAALFMGSGSGGGLVNMVRKRGLYEPSASLTTSIGSWNNHRVMVDAGAPLDAEGRLRSRVVASWQEQDYFWDVSHKDKWLTYATLDYQLTPRTVVSLTGSHQEDHMESPNMGLPAYTDGRFLDVSRSTHVYPEWARFAYETTEVALDLEHVFDNGWQLKGKLLDRTQDKFWKDAFPAPGAGAGVDPDTGVIARYNRRKNDSDFERRAFDLYLSGPFSTLGRNHHATIGYNRDRLFTRSRSVNAAPFFDVPVNNPDIVSEPDFVYTNGTENETTQNGIYGQLRLSLAGPLTLVLGGRSSNFEYRSRNVAPSAVTGWTSSRKETGEFTPYGAVIYAFTDNLNGYVSYSDIFIPQAQQTADGASLEPRVGAQWETGLKASFLDGAVGASIALFRTNDTNRAMSDLNNPGFFISAGEVEVEGWEMEITGQPSENLNLSVGYSYLTSEYVEDQFSPGQKFSLYEPRHSLKTYAKYRLLDGEFKGLFVGGGVHVSSGTDGSSDTPLRSQGGYALASAQIGYEVNDKTSVALMGNNLFDRHYYARVGNLNTYNTYGEPRSFTLVLRSGF